jgi:hypothetical protein
MGSLSLSNFIFALSRVEVSHKLFFIPIIKRGREGGDLRGSVVKLFDCNEKFAFWISCLLCLFTTLILRDFSFSCVHSADLVFGLLP